MPLIAVHKSHADLKSGKEEEEEEAKDHHHTMTTPLLGLSSLRGGVPARCLEKIK